jgi:membrane protease YdiL (CAAX protease family)
MARVYSSRRQVLRRCRNGLAGVVFGWLYWRRGLLAAMVAHLTFDLVLHVIVPALRGGA